jgi:hypothetical protein
MADDELTEAGRRALDALPKEARMPADYEDRVVGALHARGLLAPAPPGRRRLVHAGLAAGLFGTGLGAGLLASRNPGPAPGDQGPLFLLLLYPGPRYAPGTPADERARVAEYGAWAGRLRRAGQLVSAERLGGASRLLGDEEGGALTSPQGFFLVRARDDREAEEIARACPHLRHGGRVAVHAVART